ncbi:MAG: DUF4348 domain-containing protein [Prevotella sp.]|uniref:DUF4348 domain-containing protein n=1 Tax=Prevotella sp. TaxID=59823 RepID=UPI002A270B44|nr:DUF4348 domain-containing protein [Prevotella sp.]MDD7317976.1 DUF4348 domain-containing protein [Prevotellaceae bacterium]MDY4020404.1 DUF4348 domain-containing protein [Prevotella sp.]
MKTLLLAFLAALCLGCSSASHDKPAPDEKQMQQSEKWENPTTDFKNFVKKYSSDPDFQKTHTSFPLKMTVNDMEDEAETTVSYVSKDEWTFTNICDSEILGEKVVVEINEKDYVVDVKGEESGISVSFIFKKIDNTWLLSEIVNSSM